MAPLMDTLEQLHTALASSHPYVASSHPLWTPSSSSIGLRAVQPNVGLLSGRPVLYIAH